MSLKTERIVEDAFITCFLIYEAICSHSVHLSLATAESPFFCCCLCCFWRGAWFLKKPRYEMHHSPTAAPSLSPVAVWLFDVNVIKACRRLLVTTHIKSKKASPEQTIHIDGLTKLAYFQWFFFSCCNFSGPFIVYISFYSRKSCWIKYLRNVF